MNEFSGVVWTKEQIENLDNNAVDRFAKAMKDKLALCREKGKYGWEDLHQDTLLQLFWNQFKGPKTDWIDISNYAMMLWMHMNNMLTIDLAIVNNAIDESTPESQPYLFPVNELEPYFTIRGRDPAAVVAIQAWIDEKKKLVNSGILSDGHGEFSHINAAQEMLTKIRDWQPKSFGKHVHQEN